MMCSACEELREEVARLRRELAHEIDEMLSAKLKKVLGCRPQGAAILAALYRAGQRYTSDHALRAAVDSEAETRNLIKVQIWHLRKFLPQNTIESIYARGYRLTEEGRAHIAALVGDAA